MSESLLWTLQNNAYTGFGASAWTKGLVPIYITSNPFIAKQYAQLALGYVRDLLSRGIDEDAPLYLLDLGAGSGRFAYLFITAFLSMVPPSIQEHVRFCYVMTDIAESTFAFWQEHPMLEPFFSEGLLECAYYHHAQNEAAITLKKSGTVLSSETLKNPLILMANYFFDTIPQDLFGVREGRLVEGRITLSVDESIDFAPDDPKNIPHLERDFRYVPITDSVHYYPEIPVLGELLEHYRTHLRDCTFLFPIGGYHALQFFRKLSHDRFLLLAGDQGVSTLAQIERWGEPVITKHDTFSIAVNYHSLAAYFNHVGGMGLLTSMSDPLFAVIAGVMGGDEHDYPETVQIFNTTCDSFEPKDYWNIVTLAEERGQPSLDEILLLLKLGEWDPFNMHAFYGHIRKLMPQATAQQKEHLYEGIHRTMRHFYYVGEEEGDFVLNLGVLLFELGQYRDALSFFERSLTITGERAQTYSNMGACHSKLHDQESAFKCFTKAKTMTPHTH